MITSLRTYMELSAVLLISASIAPRAIAVTWSDPNNQDWTYKNWGLSSTVYTQGKCWGAYDRENHSIDIVFKQEYCPNAVLQGDSVTLQCIGNRSLTISPANHVFRGSGFVGAGIAYGKACGQSVDFQIKGTRPGDSVKDVGLVFHTNSERTGDLFSSPIEEPKPLPLCSGALQSTTLTWENLMIGDNISRKTIPFVYKCEFGGGDILINITETTVSHEAPKLQYDIGGDIFTDSYSLSCSDSCEKSIDFGVSGKSAVTAAGKFTYSLLVSTYQK
ncbi:hypothetical protein FPJ26_12885 [Salmonella enterica]|nr:hypothetical protein [Salmonella enterica]